MTAAKFQSTPPQGERRHDITSTVKHGDISIHAPTRGATANIYKKITNFHIHLPHYITKKGGSPLLAQKNSIFNSLFNAKNSANLPAFLCLLPLRTIKLLSLPDQTCPSFHNAQLCSYSDFPDNKNANCLFPHQ